MTDIGTQSPAAPSLDPSPPDRRGIAWWWIAVFFVVAALIGALAVVFLGTDRNPSTAPPPAKAASCDVPGGSQEIPTSTPAGIEWRVSTSKVVLPYSATSGPLNQEGPLARCYSHDPVGALLAASQIYPRSFTNANRQEARQVVKEQFVPGPKRDELLQSLSTAPTEPPEQIQWRAFKYLSYTPTTAVLVLALESASDPTAIAGVPVTVEWQDGDWKYNLEQFAAPYSVDSAELTTYVQWSGIR